jgi:serine/threonine-protein kinase SRK2
MDDGRGRKQALYAVKFVQRGELVDEAIKKEVINHCMLMHENIARFREVILCPRHLAIVMEFAQGGDLFAAVQQSKGHKMNEPMARYFFQQLIAGLGYMHCQVLPRRLPWTTSPVPRQRSGSPTQASVSSVQGMCHRDLKLENLLLTDNPPKLKICDFGYSKSMKWQSQAKSKVGTAAYIAPEVITAARGSQYNSEAVDVWSSGVVLHTMLAGMYPFCDVSMPNDETRTIRRILEFMKGVVGYAPPAGVSEGGVDLLRRMLVADPSQRININDIINHKWFQANLPRGCTTAACPPDPSFPQQAVEQMQAILQQAVVLGSAMGAPATIAEHTPTYESQGALDRQTSEGSILSHGLSHNLEDGETFTPAASLTLADSGVDSMLET